MRGGAPSCDAIIGARRPKTRRVLPPAILAATALLSACKQLPESRYHPEATVKEQGLAAIKRAGCGACHDIPGVDWPRGRLGPSLRGFSGIGLIAGAVPNTAENLAAFIRNAPAVKPGSTMPPIPLSEQEARAIAAYLYGINSDA